MPHIISNHNNYDYDYDMWHSPHTLSDIYITPDPLMNTQDKSINLLMLD